MVLVTTLSNHKKSLSSNLLQREFDRYMSRIAIIRSPDCTHPDFSLELIASILGVKLTLSANEITLFATGLQLSGLDHIICERFNGFSGLRHSTF